MSFAHGLRPEFRFPNGLYIYYKRGPKIAFYPKNLSPTYREKVALMEP